MEIERDTGVIEIELSRSIFVFLQRLLLNIIIRNL